MIAIVIFVISIPFIVIAGKLYYLLDHTVKDGDGQACTFSVWRSMISFPMNKCRYILEPADQSTVKPAVEPTAGLLPEHQIPGGVHLAVLNGALPSFS